MTALEKEYELSKNNPGFNLSKTQHLKVYKEIYLNTFEPWADQQFSGSLLIENQEVALDDSMFDITEANGNLFEDAFFDKHAFNQKISCMIPASAIVVVGFVNAFRMSLD